MIQPISTPALDASAADLTSADLPALVPVLSPASPAYQCAVIQPGEAVDPLTLVEVTERMRRFTAELIPGKLQIEVDTDPEFGDRKICFRIDAPGTLEDLVRYNTRWHREMFDVAHEFCPFFVLILMPAV